MWLSRRLSESHDLAGFRSGQAGLDEWLQREALRAQQQDIERVTVWTDETADAVVAFYAIKPTQITAETVSRGLSGGHAIVPGWLLARLALHEDLRGQGLGGQLLLDALEACVVAARHGAGRVIVVDPIDDAAAGFYARYGFVGTRVGRRMVMKVATARRALGGDGR